MGLSPPSSNPLLHISTLLQRPCKVLLTGGYLILDRPNVGLVLTTNARFFAIVKHLYDHAKPDSWAWGWTDHRCDNDVAI